MGKIKLFLESDRGKDILVILIIILVGLASFELGRLSRESTNGGLKIDYKGQEANIIGANASNLAPNADIGETTNSQTRGSFFASKKGTKYYGVTCSAGKTIKEKNKIYFSTADDAIKAGYQLSNSCK